VVHDVGFRARPRGVGRDGDVGAHNLDAVREVGSSKPIHGTHAVASGGKVLGHGEAERAGPEDDVDGRLVHVRLTL
jgi:hypothetical protein